MCFFTCQSNDILMKHIVRYHRHNPDFKVKCTQDGCGATYQKWKSFRQHLFRKHPMISVAINNIIQEPEVELLIGEEEPQQQNFDQELFQSPIKRLQWHSAKFLIDIRENCKVSQNAMKHIIDGITSLVEKECQRLKDPQTQVLHFEDVRNVLVDKYPPTIIFSMKQKTFLQVWNGKKKKSTDTHVDLREVQHDAYIVPFMDNLRNLLMNEEIRSNIDHPLEHEDGIYRTVLDGSYYQANTFFRENKNSLAIILYYDDLGIANPLGSSSKIHKLSMFYWVLANIKPELRSSQNAIQLLAIVKSNYAKESKALEKILKPFIDDIVKLQTEGIDIYINGSKKNYRGSLLFFAGDTPASALIGGFKESVAANHPCRSCMITKGDLKNYFKESDLVLRNKNDHNDHLSAINEPNLTKRAKEFWQKTYGVNNRSPLMEIPHFDITICLPQDCMHILIEGVAEITCRLFLCYCIIEKELFCINDLNEKLVSFHFEHFSKDKPAAIQRSDLAIDKPLRQSAAQ
ncbi:PREDICTED: uncharacterized protein LOC105564455, partial [Vollenhovia emeryi]|uniref:uncharacterized protein LOC105564455 n=1 Tax=Vollenhovia emeryi TaxID=411798 RepID=UPI0005F4A566